MLGGLKKMFGAIKAGLGMKKSGDNGKHCPAGKSLTKSIQINEGLLRQVFKDCADVKQKKIAIPSMNNRRALVFYTEGLVSADNLTRDIISPLLAESEYNRQVEDVTQLIAVGQTSSYSCLEDFTGDILRGKIAIIVDGSSKAVIIDIKKWPGRSVEEPLQERLIRGPREGFTEVLQVNRGLVRRRLPDPNLKVFNLKIGRRTKTEVSMLYIEDVCNLDTVQEVKERLEAIDIDGILDSGVIAELISERTISPFPLHLSTERPDKVVGGLLQGKVVILTDGSPFALVLPSVATDWFQTPEDYYMHPLFATIGRVLRLLGIFAVTTLTAVYTAIIMYHYEMIPSNIIFFIAQSREGVPFSPLTEALLLEFAAELMREASIRLPGPVSHTLSIVGALILGQAVVSANLVSPVLLIIVATTFLAGSVIPNYEASLAVRYLRFPMLLAAGFL
ncbi:MAG TPA: spore germination protein [Firmicutes bacterium]|jgi:spore germination protein KA/spore germination protein|nr:spore germination protein [Bacillota bacterium]